MVIALENPGNGEDNLFNLRSLRLCSLGKRRPLRDATRIVLELLLVSIPSLLTECRSTFESFERIADIGISHHPGSHRGPVMLA
jgi:hypothetical protein